MISERRIYAQRDVQQFGGRKFTVARLLVHQKYRAHVRRRSEYVSQTGLGQHELHVNSSHRVLATEQRGSYL